MIEIRYRYPDDPGERPDTIVECQEEERPAILRELKEAGAVGLEWREMRWTELMARNDCQDF
jgi:hypothetical protein